MMITRVSNGTPDAKVEQIRIREAVPASSIRALLTAVIEGINGAAQEGYQ